MMTSPIGPRKDNRGGSSTGFTLLELLLVALLISVLVGIAVPRLYQTWRGVQTDHLAYNMAQLLTSLGERAVAESKVYRLKIQEDPMQYWVERSSPSSGLGGVLHFKPVRSRYFRKRWVPRHLSLELEQGKDPLFFPDGQSSLFTLLIREEGQEVYSLSTKGVYGYVQLKQTSGAQ
jgi:prepilin-type N-terminal cleavage/methylation domain-containing protein